MISESEQQRQEVAESYIESLTEAYDNGTLEDYLEDKLDSLRDVDYVMTFDFDGTPIYRGAIATLGTGGPGVYLDTYEKCLTVSDMGGKTHLYPRFDVINAADKYYSALFERCRKNW